MSHEKAVGIVVRCTDWSETSRIVTLWTREFGKIQAIAKGGRRLKSNFEVALDLLNICSIVLIRNSVGRLDILTEARVEHRFTPLRSDLNALNAGYYIAELLGDGTQENDPHPGLFELAVHALEQLRLKPAWKSVVALFEVGWLHEIGYQPCLDCCVACRKPYPGRGKALYTVSGGGLVCRDCSGTQRQRMVLAETTLQQLVTLNAGTAVEPDQNVREILNLTVTEILGRPSRVCKYLPM
ncbi:MAG: DNA repair protein RecO [Zavarzinella sp.]